MKVLLTLIRREFWEHRVLVIVPFVMCVLYLALAVLASANVHMDGIHINGGGPGGPSISLVMHILFTGAVYGLTSIVAFFYLCDCLYSERKDRTILFWKSMPVSDAMTVLSKLLTVLIMLPLIVYALSLVTHLLVMLVFSVAAHFGPPQASPQWTLVSWLQLNGYLLMDVFVFALWFAPIVGYQLLISVAARRAVFVWTVLPPLTLVLGQALLFDNWSIGKYILHRLGALSFGGNYRSNLDAAVESVNALPMLRLPELWIGVAIAAVLVFVAIRIRRHRDDT
jgi:ABC-2 type transport system permease protein